MLTPVASQPFEFSFRKTLAFVRAMTSVAHRRITKTDTIIKLQMNLAAKDSEIAAKDIEIAKLKAEIEVMKIRIVGCDRCGRFASGSCGKYCEECYYTHFFRQGSQ